MPKQKQAIRRKKTQDNSRTSRGTITREQMVADALRARLRGWSYRRIGQEMEVDASTAYRLVAEGIEGIAREPAQAVVTMELERLDQYLDGLYDKAIKGDPQCVDRALKISERRGKLAGLDAPEKHEHEHKGEQSAAEWQSSFIGVLGRIADAIKVSGGGGN